MRILHLLVIPAILLTPATLAAAGSRPASNQGNGTTCQQDAYEPDDSPGQASTLSPGATQSHSICPVAESDWATFTLTGASHVVLETSGASGDTRMWLYDGGLSAIDFNDDAAGFFSRIERPCGPDELPAGTYYVEVDEYFDDDVLDSYTLSLSVSPCAGQPDIHIEPLSLSFSSPLSAKRRTPARVLEDRTVHLRNGTVDPQAVPGMAKTLARQPLNRRRHLLMQFGHMPGPEERARLADGGLKILTYLPHQTYWVSVTEGADTLKAAAPAGGVAWAWSPPPEHKMSSTVAKGDFPAHSDFGDGTVTVHVLVFEDVSHLTAEAAFAALDSGIQTVEWPSPRLAAVRGPWYRMAELAALDIVEWVETEPAPDAVDNETSAARIRVDEIRPAPLSLDGHGVVAGIWDGGAVFAHDDFGSRLTVVDRGEVSNHATHVAGTIGGSGAGNPEATGMAPSCGLRSYDWSNDEAEMRAATGNGIVLSNHSYGILAGWTWEGGQWVKYSSEPFGRYSATTQDWDDIVFDTDLLVFKSAGNHRNDCGAPGDCDGPYDSITQKGVAKNIVTICATDDFDEMSSFSSWGPADDGRVKPDLCANGVSLTSTLPDQSYGSMSGTSMASPSAAGSAALLHQHFVRENGEKPAAATLKALMIHGAQDLGRTGPDYEFGWGLIDARKSADLITTGAWRTGSIARNFETRTYPVTVPEGTPSLKVTLAWTDPAGSPAASKALINDLNVVVTDPNFTDHLPWILDKTRPSAAAGRGFNTVDNVEQVFVADPQAGEWIIAVYGTAVPSGPQAFTVVAEGLGDTVFTITNEGTGALDVTSIAPQTQAPWITLDPSGTTVAPGGSALVRVLVDFSKAPPGESTTRILVRSNDPDESPYPNGVNVLVRNSSGLIFADGFESGNTSAWSRTVQ